LCGLSLRNHVNAKTNTEPKITYSPAILKNAKIIPGIVCPNNTTRKLENELIANIVKIYVLQSKIFRKVFIPVP
jgi:hypothetical protein